MRIAVAELHGLVNQHFGQTQRFAVLEITGQEVGPIEYVDAGGLQHLHEGLASLLQRTGAEVVITGGIGPGAINALQEMGFQVVTGASGPVHEVAALFARGELKSSGAVCQAHH